MTKIFFKKFSNKQKITKGMISIKNVAENGRKVSAGGKKGDPAPKP